MHKDYSIYSLPYIIIVISTMPRLQLKRARVAYPCRVCTRECMLEQEGIQCDGCECWLHQQCVGMTTTQYVHFSQPHLQFFCRQCVGNNAAFNFSSSLSRISVLSPDLAAMKLQADSEQNLLQFYNVLLPQVSTVSTVDVVPHKQSELLLRDKSPWILDQYVPADVAGDGNCLFRAVSLALYGCQTQHVQLRLRAAIEVLLNASYYDSTSDVYYEPYRVDQSLLLTDYRTFVRDLVRDGAYSDMHTVLAISAVIQKPIQTRWPIVVRDAWESPMTKFVVGRDVPTEHPVNILWTIGSTKYAGKGSKINLNHFVPLISRPSVVGQCAASQVIDENEDAAEMPSNVGDGDGTVDSTADDDDVCYAQDGNPLQNRFLPTSECIKHLQSDTPGLESVPNGIKENMWFKVRHCMPTHKFWDDCGAWAGSSGRKVEVDGYSFAEVCKLPNGLYGQRKRIDGKRRLVELERQPDQVVELHQLCSRLKRDGNYQRRITYIGDSECFLAEYLGAFPSEVTAHGNSVYNDGEYVRSKPQTLSDIKNTVQATGARPHKVYQELKANTDDDQACPRNKKQVMLTYKSWVFQPLQFQ